MAPNEKRSGSSYKCCSSAGEGEKGISFLFTKSRKDMVAARRFWLGTNGPYTFNSYFGFAFYSIAFSVALSAPVIQRGDRKIYGNTAEEQSTSKLNAIQR